MCRIVDKKKACDIIMAIYIILLVIVLVDYYNKCKLLPHPPLSKEISMDVMIQWIDWHA